MYEMKEFENDKFRQAFIKALEENYLIRIKQRLAKNVYTGIKMGAVIEKEYCYKCVYYSSYGQNPTQNDIEIFKEDKNWQRENEIAEKLSGCKGIVTTGVPKIISFAYENENHRFIYYLSFVMEMDYYPDDLSKKISKKRQDNDYFTDDEIIQIGMDICDALISMHKVVHNGKRITHNDIKPENIFINNRGDYVLGDFGISREVAVDLLHKTSGGFTEKYVSPEIYNLYRNIDGEYEKNLIGYDHRSDIYSLGTVLYMLVNNYKVQDTMQRSAMDFIMPSPAGSRKSDALKNVIMKAVEWSPYKRYQSADEFKDALSFVKKLVKNEQNVTSRTEENESIEDESKVETIKSIKRFFSGIISEKKSNLDDDATEDEFNDNSRIRCENLNKIRLDAVVRRKNRTNEENVDFYIKEANQGNIGAQCRLAKLYLMGWGCEQDYVEARKWYKKAANQGDISSQFCLGDMYENGYGVKKSFYIAKRWYKKAANQGDISSQFRLGSMYYYGNGDVMFTDYAKAFKWLKKVAEQEDDMHYTENAIAQYLVGEMYEKGKGVKQNYTEAIDWYEKAVDHKNEDAFKAIERISEKGVYKATRISILFFLQVVVCVFMVEVHSFLKYDVHYFRWGYIFLIFSCILIIIKSRKLPYKYVLIWVSLAEMISSVIGLFVLNDTIFRFLMCIICILAIMYCGVTNPRDCVLDEDDEDEEDEDEDNSIIHQEQREFFSKFSRYDDDESDDDSIMHQKKRGFFSKFSRYEDEDVD